MNAPERKSNPYDPSQASVMLSPPGTRAYDLERAMDYLRAEGNKHQKLAVQLWDQAEQLHEPLMEARRALRQRPPTDHMVYAIEAVGAGLVKIGRSSDAERRLRELQTGSSYPLNLIGVWHSSLLTEQEAHARFGDQRAHGEWFHLTPEIRLEIENYIGLTAEDNEERRAA